MTREEAVQIIKSLKGEFVDYGLENKNAREAVEALDMAKEALQRPLCDDAISRQVVIGVLKDKWNMFSDANDAMQESIDTIESLRPVSSSENPNKWTPIKTRPLTNKEKEEYADLGYSEDSIDSMYDCHLPEDGEEVLITTRYDEVTTDTFYRDEGCYFETYCDKDDVKAWMHLPEPYKAESEKKE